MGTGTLHDVRAFFFLKKEFPTSKCLELIRDCQKGTNQDSLILKIKN